MYLYDRDEWEGCIGFYRDAELFESQTLMVFEHYQKLGLSFEPPTDWKRFEDLARDNYSGVHIPLPQRIYDSEQLPE